MDRTERFYKINQQLENGHCVSFEKLREACEVSRATLQRDLEYMRTRLNAPILYDRERNGYRLARETPQVGAQWTPAFAEKGPLEDAPREAAIASASDWSWVTNMAVAPTRRSR